MNSNSYSYSSLESTIVISTLTVIYAHSNILSYFTKRLHGNFRKLITCFLNLSVFGKFIEPCLNTPEVDLYYVLYSTMISGFSDQCAVKYMWSEVFAMQCKSARFFECYHETTTDVCHHKPINFVVYTYESTCMACKL